MGLEERGGDGAGPAAVVEDCGGLGEGEGGVCAGEERLDGGGGGAGSEGFVFGGEGVPVGAFGWVGVSRVVGWECE